MNTHQHAGEEQAGPMRASCLQTPNAPVFDPRYNNLVLNFTYKHLNNLPASQDVTLRVTNGEGQVWLDPAETPTLGTITQGRLVIASESFPRYAPLTMTLTGADLLFHVRQSRLLSFALTARDIPIFRLLCMRMWAAAYRYELRWPSANQLIVSRFNQADEDRETQLEINVLKGASPDPIVGELGDARLDPGTRLVLADKVRIRRADDGELVLRLHGARMEWDFAGGTLTALRVFDSRGTIAVFSVLDLSGAGVAVTGGFLDTLS